MALAERADTEQVSRNTVNITPKLNNTSAQNMTANAKDHNQVTDDTGSESSWDSDAEDQKEMVKQQKDSSRTSRWAQAIINNSCLGTDPGLIYSLIDMSRERYLSSVSARESLQSRPTPPQNAQIQTFATTNGPKSSQKQEKSQPLPSFKHKQADDRALGVDHRVRQKSVRPINQNHSAKEQHTTT
ncbi:hypothetical protein M438DRAFT_360189 [Aureobasidium pullulans EXF-150]|uniref:Uncharacterized protein n=1 Tax=Aureobasidium pullulans EXF-150 TaxID=1043002 RepID=A0A074X505_AURPU|nr:uncharacterized protein M438DRAFT_360189 [Aureobasidium pullulans EXF-150]KEQ78869.1 hypothetical protein M438DRAFT_360189 [Aureobasidium pullulans EXF-150]